MKRCKLCVLAIFLMLNIFMSTSCMGSCAGVWDVLPDTQANSDLLQWPGWSEENEITSGGGNFGENSNDDSNNVETEKPQPSSELQYTESSDGTSYIVTGVSDASITELVVPATYNEKPISSIEKGAFASCANLKSITLPFVGESDVSANSHFGFIFGAGYDWENETYVPASLESVTITDDASIEKNAFLDCLFIKRLCFSDRTRNIESDALGTLNLEEITLPSFSGKFISMFSASTYQYGYEESNENQDIVRQSLKKVTLTDFDDDIPARAFENFSALESISIRGTYQTIGVEAFIFCKNLQAFTMSENVKEIGNSAFYGCTNLMSIEISEAVERIGEKSFEDCENLTSVIIPGRVTSLASRAFAQCVGLTDISLPGSLKTIGNEAFAGCSSLKKIVIPKSVETLKARAFADCTSLVEIELKNSNIEMEYAPFDGCTNLKELPISENQMKYAMNNGLYQGTGIESVTIPSSIQNIPQYAFADCQYLTHVNIEGSNISIEPCAFTGCIRLTNFPWQKIRFIGAAAFRGCGFTSVDLSSGIILGDGVFDGCTDLTSVILPTNIDLKTHSFSGCSKLAEVHWAGEVSSRDSLGAIQSNAFMNCVSLTHITLPKIGYIAPEAFAGCNNLQSVTMNESVKWVANFDGEYKPHYIDVTDPQQNAEFLTSKYLKARWEIKT